MQVQESLLWDGQLPDPAPLAETYHWIKKSADQGFAPAKAVKSGLTCKQNREEPVPHAGPEGKAKVNVLPAPGVEVASREPPCASTMAFAIASPSPLLPSTLERTRSAR